MSLTLDALILQKAHSLARRGAHKVVFPQPSLTVFRLEG
jgi:hypothetical protein